MTKEEVFDLVLKIQTGHFDKNDIDRYDPEITGEGVTIMALAKYGPDEPGMMSEFLEELEADGAIRVYFDKNFTLPSFHAIKN